MLQIDCFMQDKSVKDSNFMYTFEMIGFICNCYVREGHLWGLVTRAYIRQFMVMLTIYGGVCLWLVGQVCVHGLTVAGQADRAHRSAVSLPIHHVLTGPAFSGRQGPPPGMTCLPELSVARIPVSGPLARSMHPSKGHRDLGKGTGTSGNWPDQVQKAS